MAKKSTKSNKFKDFLLSWKQGLKDISDVMNDPGGWRLFIKAWIVIGVGFLVLRWGTGKLDEQTKEVRTQIEAIRVQQNSEQDYLTNKNKLLSLEPLFPDVKAKDQWLISQIIELFRQANVTANMNEPQLEMNTNPNYAVVSKKVTFTQNFLDFGKLLADIENSHAFLYLAGASTPPALRHSRRKRARSSANAPAAA